MKLEYRDLSSSRTEPLKGSRLSSLGYLDFFAASLLIFVTSCYFVLPLQLERSVDWVVYEPANNSYASIRCIRDKTTKYQFTQSRDVMELRYSAQLIRFEELKRYARPQPDAGCFAVRGLVEVVPRWEYFFGWLSRTIS